jgi:pyrroline-5-carboxylate reductase
LLGREILLNVTFVGGGNMASALIGGLLAQGLKAEHIAVVEIDAGARARLSASLGVRTHAQIDVQAVGSADELVLAVKPQQMCDVARMLAPHVRQQLVISIAAGIRLADLSRWLGGYRKLVRAMPNTPALIRAGVSGLYALPEVAPAEREHAQTLLGAAGRTLWCAREDMLDAVTAVSGSGPAYVFYFLEALETAARELGFNATDARTLAYETFSGAVRLAQQIAEEPATLRARVTSKGGTTECALARMEAAAVKASIVAAVKAADARAKELGDTFGQID